jgi:hypothetical protein
MAKSAARHRNQHPDDGDDSKQEPKATGNRLERNPDKALERLVDRSPSRVGVEAAMRARDVSRQR